MENTNLSKAVLSRKKERSGKCVIVSGGLIEREFAREIFANENFEYIIGADRGLKFLSEENIEPTHIVGDFDSLEQGILDRYTSNPNVTIRIFNPIKDKTDTEIALHLAVELNASQILLLGGNGPRVDHTLVNIQSLMVPLKAGIPCVMADACNRIRLLDQGMILRKEEVFGKYLSLVPLGGVVKGLSLSGVKYPLSDYDLTPDDSLGVSNEITEKTATISFRDGKLIMIMSKDGEMS